MPGSYAHVTFAQAKAQLAQLLDDTGNVYWADAELGIYIQEALRMWGSASLYWRERGVFATAANTPFYALQDQFPSLLGYTVTDQDVVKAIQYHLLEPATGNSWIGTDMFTLSDLTKAIQRRRNQFLVDTGCRVNRKTVTASPQPFGRFPLDDDVIDVRRVVWGSGDTTTWDNFLATWDESTETWDSLLSAIKTVVWREDEWQIGAGMPGWPQTPAVPAVYSVVASPPLNIQLAPPPAAVGVLDLITVNSGADLDPTTGVVLGIPDDFAWAVKFGAMADLLGMDGQARDPMRAQYCEQRWQEGVDLCRIYTSIMQLQINDVPVYVTSLQELDSAVNNWQTVAQQPTIGALAGQNLLALANIPDGVYGISADVVRRTPIPTADGDFLQIGREELDSILRYAEHLACFKMAGAEFKATMPQYEGLMREAMVSNARLKANASNFEVLTDRGMLEESKRPRRQKEAQPA